MSKFNVWIDTPITGDNGNVLSADAFNDTNNQRANGFRAGTGASSVYVNSGLRQANLVVAALMNIIDTNSTYDLTSSVTNVQNLMSEYFNKFALKTGNYQTLTVGNSTKAIQDSDGNTINTTYAKQNGTYNSMTVGKADFAETARKSESANAAQVAIYASEDVSKGTIEERLTSLGFKTGGMVITGEPSFTGTNIMTRQGNYAIANLDITFNEKQHTTGPTLFTIDIDPYGNFNAIDYETLKGYAMLTFSYSDSPNVTMKKAFGIDFINSYTMAIRSLYDDVGPYEVEKIEILNFGFRVLPL